MQPRDNRIVKSGKDGLLKKFGEGVDRLVDAVTATMGPRGANVAIERQHGLPGFTKDGVTVAREMFLEDSDENVACQALKSASVKTSLESGDGTTTTAALAGALFRNGLSALDKVPPLILRKGMDAAAAKVTAEIASRARPGTPDELRRVAGIAANDQAIGDLVHSVLAERPDRPVMLEDGAAETRVEDSPGFRFLKGVISTHFINSPQTGSFEAEDVSVLVYDGKLSSEQDLAVAVEKGLIDQDRKKNLLVIAEDVDSAALQVLVLNATRGALRCCAVKAPFAGSERTEIYRDIAALVGGKVLTEESFAGELPEGFMGLAKSVSSTRYQTTVVVDGQTEEAVLREQEARKGLEDSKSVIDRERFNKRLGILSARIAVIYAGGATDGEVAETRDRIEDALQAYAAAASEGILPGGGNALAVIGRELLSGVTGETNEDLAARAVYSSLSAPATAILANAGEELGTPEWNRGIDVSTLEEKEDLIAAGVIDPAKVARVALKNAVSVAGLLLTTSRSVTFKEKAKSSRDI